MPGMIEGEWKGKATKDDLRRALQREHPCDDNSCDIRAAMRAGCYLWAAHLLSGATDEGIEETCAILDKLKPAERTLEAERKKLLKVPHVNCEHCNAYIWDAHAPVHCDNCGKVATGE